MDLYVSLLTGGTNSHEETSENANAIATDFVSEGVIGAITDTSGVAPLTGAFATNAQSTPDMTVKVSSGVAYVKGTPTSQNSQTLRVRMSADPSVTISDNSSGSTKYDWLYIKLDADKLANPAVDGDDPATLVTSRSSSSSSDDGTPPTYGYCIAVITVADSASSITNGNITDKRALASSVQDGSVTIDKLYDSGWKSLALPSGASGTYRYRKIANQVFIEMSFTSISVSNGSSLTLTSMPTGYLPNSLSPLRVLFGGSAIGVGFVTGAGVVSITNRSGSSATAVDVMGSYLID